MSYLDELENEAVDILRETLAQFERPVILFSGGKDSICVLALAIRAFCPGRMPFQVLHIDTGHNFSETIAFRDQMLSALSVEPIIRKVSDTIAKGRAKDEGGPYPSRNRLQSVTLLDAISEFKWDAAIGGARRDEEKARAKERIFSFRDSFGGWNPKLQRAECWNLYNGKVRANEHMRVFPLSNWTELDVWRYIQRENLSIPSLYFSHERLCVKREDGSWLAHSTFIHPEAEDQLEVHSVRFRTVGDMTCTAPVFSRATTISEVIQEITASKLSERGSRMDDLRATTAMEDRKREGYF